MTLSTADNGKDLTQSLWAYTCLRQVLMHSMKKPHSDCPVQATSRWKAQLWCLWIQYHFCTEAILPSHDFLSQGNTSVLVQDTIPWPAQELPLAWDFFLELFHCSLLELFHSLKSPCSPKLLHGWQAYAVIWGYPCLLRPFQKHFANDSPVILLQPTPVLVFTSWDIQINLMDTSPDYKQENIGSVFK